MMVGMLKVGRCYLKPDGLVYNVVNDLFSVVCSSYIGDIIMRFIVIPWACLIIMSKFY